MFDSFVFDLSQIPENKVAVFTATCKEGAVLVEGDAENGSFVSAFECHETLTCCCFPKSDKAVLETCCHQCLFVTREADGCDITKGMFAGDFFTDDDGHSHKVIIFDDGL